MSPRTPRERGLPGWVRWTGKACAVRRGEGEACGRVGVTDYCAAPGTYCVGDPAGGGEARRAAVSAELLRGGTLSAPGPPTSRWDALGTGAVHLCAACCSALCALPHVLLVHVGRRKTNASYALPETDRPSVPLHRASAVSPAWPLATPSPAPRPPFLPCDETLPSV